MINGPGREIRPRPGPEPGTSLATACVLLSGGRPQAQVPSIGYGDGATVSPTCSFTGSMIMVLLPTPAAA